MLKNINQMTKQWDWIEVPLIELSKYPDFKTLSNRFRSDKPVGLITQLKNLGGFSAVNLISPKYHAFWSVASLQSLYRFEGQVADTFFTEKEAIRSAFMKDLRLAKIAAKDPCTNLLKYYCINLDVWKKTIPGYSADGVTSPAAYRLRSTAVQTELVSHLVDYFEAEVSQFSDYSFFAVDDLVGFDVFHSMPSIGSYLFSRFWHFNGKECHEHQKKVALSLLESAVERLELGVAFDRSIEIQAFINPLLSLHLGNVYGENELEDAVWRRIISYRARLVRLLGWPVFYESVVRAVNKESDIGGYVGDHNITEPYSVMDELDAFLVEMRSTYPILNEPSYGL